MPRLLDAFCCSGAASVGYNRSGFDEIVGVDIVGQPRYQFDFVQGDAIEFIRRYGHEFDFIHASPPCQASTTLTKGTNKKRNTEIGREHPQLIPQTREALEATGRPYVIENVSSAPIRRDLMLCGEMFGLAVIRHRIFELGGWSTPNPPHPKHRGYVRGCRHKVWRDGPYFAVHGEGGGKGTVAEWQKAMGIDWTDVRKEIAEAIPPAYSQYIGERAMEVLWPNQTPLSA
ncbi:MULTISPECIES: DNA cytosine methyltransferase [Nocardia]|uniref:DNA cytosine methyltransferase n=1 Tax=Nocardia TaxID=1817 RepID=UPI0007A55428|nr:MULTISPECIES: DNA cytosine methyltransferase [Nocardia]